MAASGVVVGLTYGSAIGMVQGGGLCRDAFIDAVQSPWKKYLPVHFACEMLIPHDGMYLMRRLRDGGAEWKTPRHVVEPHYIG